ncbi:hypothetical protein KIW84_075986 [Lathyrus oleraceus]|uniref:Uncharacterized protein n=1 Tax=Pisum sativum TaxID=3888 RepID=A0A9D4VVA0_PEA|nr:hypothetical protein KIW84_075986 [Pisum sativum]
MSHSQWCVPTPGLIPRPTTPYAGKQPQAYLAGIDQVMLGNGQGMSITSIGNTSFPSPYKPPVTLTLNNLLVVPKITKNLISATSKVLLQGSLGKDGLYSFGNLKAPFYSASLLPCVQTLTGGNLHSTPLNSCANKNTIAICSSLLNGITNWGTLIMSALRLFYPSLIFLFLINPN